MSELARKVNSHPGFASLEKQVYSQYAYQFTETMYLDYPQIDEQRILTLRYCLATNCFEKLKNIVFFSDKPNDGSEYCQIYGIKDQIRQCMWTKKKYIKNKQDWNKYKVILPASYGLGKINTQIIGKPVIGEQNVGYTQSFISVGVFNNKTDAEYCLKYIKSKFVRAMVSVLKITQDNKKPVWFYVPQQDFSNKSDIEWDCSIEEIDKQLYKKYKLTDNEVNFIEANVKPMS